MTLASLHPDSDAHPAFAPRLPVELWLHIFRLTTAAPDALSTIYEPFCSSTDAAARADATLRAKCTLALVCKQWRALAHDFLYEDLRIGAGLPALCSSLSSTRTPAAHRARRAVLPYTSTASPTAAPPPALALLDSLPSLSVLVRPPLDPRSPTPIFEHATDAPAALPALRRLEWAFDGTGAAARAGGLNALDVLLRAAAPHLHELVLDGRLPLPALRQRRVRLPALRTLRLRRGAGACPLVARQTAYWDLPALERVVLEGAACAEPLDALWEAHGARLRALELGRGVSRADAACMMARCGALEELYLHVGAAEDGVLVEAECVHATLRRVGVCVDAGAGKALPWARVAEEVGALAEGCAALCEVALYVRAPEAVERSAEVARLRDALCARGRALRLIVCQLA
ncbi:hypothetical protein BC834DRAFT_1037783 [Gloeopeniophorella convolvens]|nr:hypothetical protein BC834DRAFT_1037783 [Gloeopeniophorella convolvens]